MASTVPINARALWFGTVGTIPADWTRDTDFDDEFLQGSDSAGDTGGGTTHTHTAGAHTHTQGTHIHNPGNLGGSAGSTYVLSGAVFGYAVNGHTHTVADSGTATIKMQNTTPTISASSGAPPYTTAIIIKPDDGLQDIPVGCGAFADSELVTANSDWAICDGGGTTEDLNNQFILGADTGDDGGDTGGSLSHNHATVAHSHTEDTHTHTPNVVGGASSIDGTVTAGSPNAVCKTHHTYTYSTVVGTNTSVAPNLNYSSSLPAYVYLLGIQNEGASASTPEGIILPYTSDTLSENGWSYCDGDNGTLNLESNQIRCTTSPSKIGKTGGSNTHTHIAPEHTHIENTHSHSPSLNMTGTVSLTAGLNNNVASNNHMHMDSSPPSWVQPTITHETFTVTTDDGRYSYRTVRFIRKDFTEHSVHIKGAEIKGCNIL